MSKISRQELSANLNKELDKLDTLESAIGKNVTTFTNWASLASYVSTSRTRNPGGMQEVM